MAVDNYAWMSADELKELVRHGEVLVRAEDGELIKLDLRGHGSYEVNDK